MKLRWTRKAARDLETIRDHIAETNPTDSKRLVNRLIERGQQIRQFPESGRTVPEYEASNVREVIEGNFRILYEIRQQHVYILTIQHGSKLLPEEPPVVDEII